MRLWTLKEAYIKAVGCGIDAPPGLQGFTVTLDAPDRAASGVPHRSEAVAGPAGNGTMWASQHGTALAPSSAEATSHACQPLSVAERASGSGVGEPAQNQPVSAADPGSGQGAEAALQRRPLSAAAPGSDCSPGAALESAAPCEVSARGASATGANYCGGIGADVCDRVGVAAASSASFHAAGASGATPAEDPGLAPEMRLRLESSLGDAGRCSFALLGPSEYHVAALCLRQCRDRVQSSLGVSSTGVSATAAQGDDSTLTVKSCAGEAGGRRVDLGGDRAQDAAACCEQEASFGGGETDGLCMRAWRTVPLVGDAETGCAVLARSWT